MSLRKLHISIAAATVMLLIGGCRIVDEPNSNFFGEDCQESDTNATFGCVDIEGRVTGSKGQPLSDVDIALTDASAGLGPDFVFTDIDGRFELRLLQSANVSSPVTITLKATARRPDGTEIVSTTQTVTVPITDAGVTPEPITVNFTLPVS
jgi:hypothetical protein